MKDCSKQQVFVDLTSSPGRQDGEVTPDSVNNPCASSQQQDEDDLIDVVTVDPLQPASLLREIPHVDLTSGDDDEHSDEGYTTASNQHEESENKG